MSRKIIIDLNETNRVQQYDEDEKLFQIEAFEQITNILREHSVSGSENNIVDCRFHDTIFIDGDRGVGKTAFMVNIEKYYKRKKTAYEKENLNSKVNSYIFLNSIDPTLLEHTEKFLSVILAKIVKMVTYRLQNNSSYGNTKLEGYYKALENLSKSLEAIKTLDKDVGIEEIASSKSSLELEQHSHVFFEEVSKMFEVDGLVMLIDDVDMAFDKGFDVLEVVRKYLASPYIIPIVAGDMNLYREIVETKFMDKIEFSKDIQILKNLNGVQPINENEQYLEKKRLLDNLVEQYLRKIFPSEYQIELRDINFILKNYLVEIKLSDKISIPIKDIQDFEISHINMGINQAEFYFDTFSNITRDFIQYLYSKKDIYKDNYKDIRKHGFSNDMNVYKESFKKTGEFYKFSNNRKKKELSILANNDYQSFEGNKYNLYKAFTSKDFSNMQKFKNIELSVDTYSIQSKKLNKLLNDNDDDYKDISNYIIDLFIFNDYYSSHQRRNYIYSGKFVEYMIYGFSINMKKDFISRELKSKINNNINQFQKNTVNKTDMYYDIEYFEKLNNEIYSILYDEVDEDANNKELSREFNNILIDEENGRISQCNKDLKNIANKIPFGSEFLTNNRYKEEKFEDIDNEDLLNNYNLDELSRATIIWREVFLDNVKLNSISIFEILYKFFTNFEKIKESYRINNIKTSPNNSTNKVIELSDTPVTYLQRIVLIFINSIAFFENRDEKVANINMAIGKEFNLENILSKSATSLLNIKPMFDKENSLTRALFFHPIISHILFPHHNSKLKQLNFINRNSLIDEADKILEGYGYKSGLGVQNRIKVMTKILENNQSYDGNLKRAMSDSRDFKLLIAKSYTNLEYKNLKIKLKELFKI